MSGLTLNNRNVVDLEVDGVDGRDYPDFCDAYFCSAVWEDTGEQLTDDELIQLGELYCEVVSEMAFEYYM